MDDRVRLSMSGFVATVALNRPDKSNALDQAMFAEIARAGSEIREDRQVRAVVLHGEGEHFCAGIDLSCLQGFLTSNAEFRGRALNPGAGEAANEFQKCAHVWREIEVPVIAAVHGVAFGGGLQIALGADIRIAAPDARLSLMEVKWGLVPDMGAMVALPRLMRIDAAKELVWSGRIVPAAEALQLGLVTSIRDDPLGAAQELADQIAARSPDAIRAGKALLDQGWTTTPAEALALEAQMQARVIGMENQREAVAANLERRPPAFR